MIRKLVKFEPDLLKRIVHAAKNQHIYANQWIRQACREKLERERAHNDAKAVQE